MKRLVCRLRGHRERMVMLPEAWFGLYAYDRRDCRRCGTVFEQRSEYPCSCGDVFRDLDEFADHREGVHGEIILERVAA